MKQECLLVGFFVLGISQLVPVLADITFFEGDFNEEFTMAGDANEVLGQGIVGGGSTGSVKGDTSVESKEDTSIGSREDLKDIETNADEKKFSGRGGIDEEQKTSLFIALGFLIILIIFLAIRYIVLEHKGGYEKLSGFIYLF